MMKIKTLVNAMIIKPDEIHWFNENLFLISKMSLDTLLSEEFSKYKVEKFNTYIDKDGLTILQLILK